MRGFLPPFTLKPVSKDKVSWNIIAKAIYYLDTMLLSG